MNPIDTVPIEILLVEDSPSDVALTREALKTGKVANTLNRVEDGVEALAYLKREGKYADMKRPDLIMLDLNLPRMDGRELLAILKKDSSFKTIPIIVLTTSRSDQDILRSYELNANCFITKPVDFEQFINVIESIQQFWLSVVTYPKK